MLTSQFAASHRGNWRVPAALLVLGVSALMADISIVTVFQDGRLPASVERPLKESLEICEGFGHGFGAALIVVAVVVLDPGRRRVLPWLLASSLGAGLVANTIKLAVRRTRPRDFDLVGGTVWDTFLKQGSGGHGMQSFPSAHTATAVGLAVILAALYPRGRWFFAMMACLVGLQRIATAAHFPSDVCAGAIVGWMVGAVCVVSLPATSDHSSDHCA